MMLRGRDDTVRIEPAWPASRLFQRGHRGGVYMPVKIKRAYDKPSTADGTRILVDGLWPRGITKADLRVSAWEKGIAPSRALRKWYGHDPERWQEFRGRYREELTESPRNEVLDRLVSLARNASVTLVFGARDAEHSNAAVIAEIIQTRLQSRRTQAADAKQQNHRSGK